MQTHLTRTVRDNPGRIHNRGEQVTMLGDWLERGTHGDCCGPGGIAETPVILRPEDGEED